MKKLILAVALATMSLSALAEDDVYKKGVDKDYIAGCDNPTEREDLSTLDVSEIAQVDYYVSPTVGDTVNSIVYVPMVGGCVDTVVDLQNIPSNITYYKFARTIDTDGLVSVFSPGRSMVIRNANPKAPGQIR